MQWVLWRLLTKEGPYQYFADLESADRASWRQKGFAEYEECTIELDHRYNVTKCCVLSQFPKLVPDSLSSS